MRNIILIIIFRVSLTFFRFRFIVTEAHIIELSIFYLFFRYRVEFGNMAVLATVIIKVLFIVFFKYSIDIRDRLRF
jgi:hypothetical protein